MSYGGTRIPPHNRKGACRKLSTYGCARRISTRRRTLFYVSDRGGTMDLWQQAITHQGMADGAPEPVSSGLVIRRAAMSPDGTRLAYSKGRRIANVWRVPILSDRPATWVDAEQVTFD